MVRSEALCPLLFLRIKEKSMTKYKLVATAAAGIEALVGKELRNLGYEVQVENGKAFFSQQRLSLFLHFLPKS